MCVCVCVGWSIGWQTDWIHDGITDVTGGSEGGDPDPSGRPAAFRATGSVGQEGQGRWRRRRRRTVFSRAPTARPLTRSPSNEANRQAGGKFDFLIWFDQISWILGTAKSQRRPCGFPWKQLFVVHQFHQLVWKTRICRPVSGVSVACRRPVPIKTNSCGLRGVGTVASKTERSQWVV